MSHIKNFKDWFRVYESAGFRYQPGMEIFEEDDKKKEKEEDIPKEGKKRLEYLVNKALDTDSKAIKTAGKVQGASLLPYDAITDWMIAAGNPTTQSNGYGQYEEFSDRWKKRFKDRKPTMKLEDCIQCMQYWNGIIDTTKTKKETIEINGKSYDVENYSTARVIRQLDQLSNLRKVKSLVEEGWNAKGVSLFSSATEYEFEGTTYSRKPDEKITFDPNLIVEKSKILLEKAKQTFVNTGKTRRDAKIDMFSPDPDSDNVWFDSGEGGKYYSKKSKEQTGRFWLWYKVISDEAQFQKLLARFDDPTYVRTVFTKMTEQDKINIIKGISDAAQKKFVKSDDAPGWGMSAIYGATSIMWWPVEAKETMPTTTVVTPAGQGTEWEVENEWDFAWPYSKGDAGKDLAMTFFKSSQAVILDGKEKEIDNAVKQILAEIKSKNGTLKSLRYRVVASTSDEPTNYMSFNQLGKNYTPEANIPLVKDRAKVIEDALISSITANNIDKSLVIKDGETLIPNNTLPEGNAKYLEKKWMRTGTPQQQAEYNALFAKAKYSGIMFNVVYTTIEKGTTPDTPEETVVSDYEVVGEWLFQIKWAGGGSYKKKKRRTHTRRPIRGIPWDKIFPDLPTGGGWGVDDLCDAYGRSGPG